MNDRDRKLVERYDAHAAAYRELWAPILRLASVQLLRDLAGQPVERLIDVGTGVGALWPDLRLAFPNARLFGFDRSHGMLTHAPRQMARAVADARSLPLQAGSVDLALSVFMLFHLDDPAAGIREARRVVRPGGMIGTVTWGSSLASPATRIWTTCLDERGATAPDPVTRPSDDLLNTPEKMSALLSAGGFDTVRAWADDLVTVLDLEHLLKLRTSMGDEKARFDSLDDQTRSDCLAAARQRLQTLTPTDFMATGTIVYAVAS
jgi:SAM-dependent methyltransferase